MPSVSPSRFTFAAVQIIGGLAYFASFNGNAVTMLPDGSWGPHGPVDAFRCAFMAPIMLPSGFIYLVGWAAGEFHQPGDFAQMVGAQLMGLSGLVNLLLPFYFFVKPRWKNRLALMMAIGLAVTVPGIELSVMRPLTNCFLWIAAVLLILSPQLLPSAYNYPIEPTEPEPAFAANRLLVPNDVPDFHKED